MKNPKTAPQLSWVPYRSFYQFLRQQASPRLAYKQMSSNLRRAFYKRQILPHRFRAARRHTQDYHEKLAITPTVEKLLLKERPPARKVLDRLILAYAKAGFSEEIALEEISRDYASIPDLPPISCAEITSYAVLFWAFLSASNKTECLLYLETTMPSSEELAIYCGKRTLREVKRNARVMRDLFGVAEVGEATLILQNSITYLSADIERELISGKKLDYKQLKEAAALASQLALAKDRLQRSMSTIEAKEEHGILSLFDEYEAMIQQRMEDHPNVTWDDPRSLYRSNELGSPSDTTPAEATLSEPSDSNKQAESQATEPQTP